MILTTHPSERPDLVLVNPVAGVGRARRALPALQRFAQETGWRADFQITTSVEDLRQRASDAAQAGRSRIFAVGGDGTFQVLVNAVGVHSDIILGLIPAGGGNDLALSLGIPLDTVAAARLLLEGTVCLLDAVQVKTADGVARLYTGGGGVGLDAEASRYAGGIYRNVRGRMRYVLSALRALAGFHSMHVRVQTDAGHEMDIKGHALLVAVLNTPSYGAGVRLAPGASMDDGKLDLVLLDNLGFFEVLTMLPALLRGDVHTKRLQRRAVKRVRIETDRPCAFHADGEIVGATPVEVEIVPSALRVLCPRQQQR
ncbi:MAG: diacylglycerol kinase family protein [Candidatus Acidiferrum sp.]